MVGTQQVGKDARPSRKGWGLWRLVFLVDHILLASIYLIKCKFIPTHLNIRNQHQNKTKEPQIKLFFKINYHVRVQTARNREHG
jgi:hypothetical protein